MNQIKKYHKKALLLLAFFFSISVYALDSDKLTLPKLLHLFEQQKQSVVDFTEEKHAFFLDEPLKSSGYLQFSAPNKLNKFILKPKKISQKVNGNILEITDTDQTNTVDLNDHPEFSVLLRSILGLLSGNLPALKKDFNINFENTFSNWNLLLSPKDHYVLSHIVSIKMIGHKNKLIRIIVTEPNNDRSITNLSNHR